MYGRAAVRKGLTEVLRRVWRKKDSPKDWTNIIVSIFKKDGQEKEENYKGISLLCTVYKIYAKVLRRRLEEWIDRKELLSESQGGFRRDRRTMDNIFILKHVVQSEGRKEDDKKLYAMFMGLKVAFDNVEREKL